MTKAIQIKLLAAILAVLTVIAGLIARGGRPAIATNSASNAVNDPPAYVLTDQDRATEKKFEKMLQPSKNTTWCPK